LQLRQLEQIVENDLGDFSAFELDDYAHARLVGLVAQIGNAFELLFADQLADAGEQRRLVYLVRYFIDDDRLASALVDLLEVRACADKDAAASGSISFAHAFGAVDDARGGKVGCR